MGRRWAIPVALAIAVCITAAARQAPTDLYKPPTQRAVHATVDNGILLAEGTISDASGRNQVSGLLVVDSAATTTILDPKTARALGGKGATGEKLADMTLNLAGAQVSHRPAVVYSVESWAQQAGKPVIGIAGSDIFQNFGARIDYENHLLTLVVLQSCASPQEHLRIRVINGLPFHSTDIQTTGGRSVRGTFLLDTGQAGNGIVLTSEFLKAHPEIVTGQGAAMRLAGLSLGKNMLANVPVTVAPPNPGGVLGATLAGVIGGGILSRFDVVFDLPQGWLTVTPNSHSADPF